MQKGLLQPLTVSRPPNLNTLGYNPNKHCKFHQNLKHSTYNCIHFKHEIQNLIDFEKIPDPEKLNPNHSTKNNHIPNYPNVPPSIVMVINSGVRKEESLDASKNEEKSKKPTALSYFLREVEKEVIEEVIEEMQD